MRKALVFIYQNWVLPAYAKLFATSFERLLRTDTNGDFCVKQIFEGAGGAYVGNNVIEINSRPENFTVLLNGKKARFRDRRNADFFYLYGSGIDIFKHILLRDAVRYNTPKIFVEDGFLRSIDLPFAEPGVSLLIDDISVYYDARYPSRLENLLNSDIRLSETQLSRARNVMKKIRETKVTKYNLAPIYEPKIGRPGVTKILVIDQAYRDFSIPFGLASDDSFEEMLACAIRENPEADIIVKTHPEAFRGGRKGYFTHTKREGNVYPYTDPICPLSLLEYVDKVYCVTTQMGFEALMCGKEVSCFGMPFYAGWGLTDDRVKCERRTKTRSLEEVFYFAYIEYAKYMNPNTGKLCKIEEAIDYLVAKRDQPPG
ncbi:capsule biosynthesis protein [Verrucomicrobiota bacterium]